ncbi:hypothetical protein E4U59_006082 [Claviceps monticola]|nr:hypothetical protein E4U59_006082 [Claviceps monticola]
MPRISSRISDSTRTLRTVGQILKHLDLIFLDPNQGSSARDEYRDLKRLTHTGLQKCRTSSYELAHRGEIGERNWKEEVLQETAPGLLGQSIYCLYHDRWVTLTQLANIIIEIQTGTIGHQSRHRDTPDDIRLRNEAVWVRAELFEEENRLARAAQEARKIEVTNQLDFTGLRRPSDPYEYHRRFVPRKKTHRLNDYTSNPFLFFHCFGTYIWICGQFFYKQHPDVPLAQSRYTSATTSGTSHKFSHAFGAASSFSIMNFVPVTFRLLSPRIIHVHVARDH